MADGIAEGAATPVISTHGLVKRFSDVDAVAGIIVRDLGAAAVPLVALLAWGVLFAAGAFRRFSRMDIVE
jgi:hypothetical protein